MHRNTTLTCILALVVGCDDKTSIVCEPGETQACVCPGSLEGAQTCVSDGSGWGICDCGTTDSNTDGDVTYDGPCRNDGDCNNGLVCDGIETCDSGTCLPGDAITCDDADDCTTDLCDEDEGGCVFLDRDEDGDGYIDEACGGDDCDDTRSDVYPGAVEDSCYDGVDQACDGITGPEFLRDTVLVEVVATQLTTNYNCSLEWTGSEFGLAWRREDGSGFQRIAADGTLHGEPVTLVSGEDVHSPVIAWTGSEFGVVSHYSGSIHLDLLSADGGLASSAIDVSSAPARDGGHHAMWSEGEFSVISQGMLHRLDSSGSPVTSAIEVFADGTQYVGNLQWTGSEFAFTHPRMDSYMDMIRMDRSGVSVSTTEVVGGDESIMLAWGELTQANLTWTGSAFGVVWNESAPTFPYAVSRFERVSADGTVIGSPIAVSHLDGEGALPAVGWTGSAFMFIWYGLDEYGVDSWLDLWVMTMDADGVIVDERTQVSDFGTPYGYGAPSIAWTGSEMGVAWTRKELLESSVFFNRIGFCN